MSHVDATRTKRFRPGVMVPLAVVVVVVVWVLWRVDQDDDPRATTTPAGDRDAAAAVDALISASEREDCDTIVDLIPLEDRGYSSRDEALAHCEDTEAGGLLAYRTMTIRQPPEVDGDEAVVEASNRMGTTVFHLVRDGTDWTIDDIDPFGPGCLDHPDPTCRS